MPSIAKVRSIVSSGPKIESINLIFSWGAFYLILVGWN